MHEAYRGANAISQWLHIAVSFFIYVAISLPHEKPVQLGRAGQGRAGQEVKDVDARMPKMYSTHPSNIQRCTGFFLMNNTNVGSVKGLIYKNVITR